MIKRHHAAAAALLIAVLAAPQPHAANFSAPDVAALIDAMERASAEPGPDAIGLAAGRVYEFDSPYADELALPPVNGEIRIEGNGATLEWKGEETVGFLHVADGGSLELEDLTLTGSSQSAVVVSGQLAVRSAAFRGNVSTGQGGGAIRVHAGGEVEVFRSVFEENMAAGRLGSSDGGGAVSNRGSLAVRGASFIDNTTRLAAPANKASSAETKTCGICIALVPEGQAIHNTGVADLVNAVISDPFDWRSNSAVYNAGDLRMVNATVAGAPLTNAANGRFRIGNSALPDTACAGLESMGYNVTTGFCPLAASTDRRFAALEPGLMRTIEIVDGMPVLLPSPGSPLLDSADPDQCPARDAAGRKRPVDGNHDGVARCDVGAAELDPGVYAVDERVTGLWFDPRHDGHYLLVERPGPNLLVVFWATFDGDGAPLWLFGGGEPDGNRVSTDLTLQRGMRFGIFDRAELSVERWGEMDLEFAGCGSATMRWRADGDPALDGTAELGRLAYVDGRACLP